jgi:hypothetical protein
MKHTLPTVALTALLLAGGNLATLSAQHNHGGTQPGPQMEDRSTTMKASPDKVLKVGKKGDVTFSSETQVGDVVLKPGKYTLQHRIEGADHVLHFAALSNRNSSGEVKCTVEPLQSKVPTTTMRLQNTGTSMRLVQVQIAGENVTHVL